MAVCRGAKSRVLSAEQLDFSVLQTSLTLINCLLCMVMHVCTQVMTAVNFSTFNKIADMYVIVERRVVAAA